MKKLFFSLIVISQLISISCNDELTSPLIDLQVSDHILDNHFITSIAFDSKGNAWIGTFKQGLIKYNGRMTYYNEINSTLPDSLVISALAIDKNDVVWIGSNKGLIKYDNGRFSIYNKSNAPLFTDNVSSVAVDIDNSIWFSSCVFRVGGIMKYDGINWMAFTPQNSALPGSLISDIIIDNQNNKWVTSNEGIYSGSIVKISGNSFHVYGKEEMGMSLYYFGNLACGPNNHIYASIDYRLSSLYNTNRPNICSFDGRSWKINNPVDEDGNSLGYVSKIAVDRRGNLWASTSDNGIAVYNGQKWIYNRSESLIKNGVYDITVDKNNSIWIGTTDGIYIIK
jgi:ligand-binding sensor domain-containing protein